MLTRVSWRRLRLAILAVLLIVGGGTALYFSILVQRSADGMTRHIRVDVWAVQQSEYELQQFRAVFARHVAGDATVPMAAVRERLAQARSSVSLLQRGPDYDQFRVMVDIDGAAALATVALDKIERALGDHSSFREDLATLQRVEALLATPVASLRQLAFDLSHIRLELQDSDLENTQWLIGVNGWMLIGFVTATLLFIAFLFQEARVARRAEATAEIAWKRLKQAVESIPEGFALFDQEDRLVLSNGQYGKFLFGQEEPLPSGLRFADVMRRSAKEGRLVEARGRVDDWLIERIDRYNAGEDTFQEKLNDGTYLQISERKTFEGGTVAVYNDVTELKERAKALQLAVERAETANRSKTEFLANMSHELRTPLNAIIGFSEIMSCEALGPVGSPEYKEYAHDIFSSGTHLLGIINDILDVSRIEAGEHRLNEQKFDLGTVIEACVRMVRERAAKVGHEISVDLPDPCPSLFGDERAVKQVLLNLLFNAVKFTPDGGGISVVATRSHDQSLLIAVADTGVGIADEDIPKAMACFGQVDTRLERKYEGTGLGLPLALKLVELHGGTMKLESEVGVGTTVVVQIPPERVVSRSSSPDCGQSDQLAMI